jgi:hypothetical protein
MKAVRKRLVVVGLALMVLLLATSAVTRATVEPPRVTVLIGPIARLDGASRWSSYDRARTMAGRRYAEGFPEKREGLWWSRIFYDLAYALYGIHYRTGDPYWRDRARIVAKAWQADPLNQYYSPVTFAGTTPCMSPRRAACRPWGSRSMRWRPVMKKRGGS